MKKLICIFTFVIIGAVTAHAQTDKAIFYQSLAWSPDGKSLAVTAMSDYDEKTDDYRTAVFVMNADGSNLKKLSEINSFFARFSPDGKRLAFVAGSFPSNTIYIANADGSQITKTTK